MKYPKNLLIVALFFNIVHSTGIKEIYSLSEAEAVLNNLDPKSIVFFDVDEVLIFPIDKIHLPKFFLVDPIKSLKIEFEIKIGSRIEVVWSKVMMQAKRVLVEPSIIINLITSLQNRKVIPLGLTKMRVGSFGMIDSLKEYRINQLKNLGVVFENNSIPPVFNKDIVFTQCAKNFNDYPEFYRGIIFSNESPKGEILAAFLDCLNYIPKQIVFFDDILDNLVSVQQEVEKRNIDYHGYHYKAVDNIAGQVNYEIAKFQLDYLHKHENWISEQEANDIINSQKI